MFDPHDIELTKRAGVMTGSHYLTEQQMATELGLNKMLWTRAQCKSVVSQVWKDYALPKDKKYQPVDLRELVFPPDAELGKACMGEETEGMHADKLVIGLTGFNKDKVQSQYLLHELAHCICLAKNLDDDHGDVFSKCLVELVCRYALKCDSKTVAKHQYIFLANKRDAAEYIKQQMSLVGEHIEPLIGVAP